MNSRLRWSLIAAAAVATGVAVFAAPEEPKPAELVTPRERPPEMIRATVRQPSALPTEWPRREPIGRPHGNLFAAYSWAPPPAPLPSEAPKPPANPYRFIGTAEHDGARKVFLALGDRVVEVKPGEKLEQGFRVQSATPQSVTLVYEPLDMPVTMALASPDQPSPAAAGATARSMAAN